MEGHLDGGIAILTEGIAALKETGTSISLGGYYLLLAQLYVLDGQREDAERALTTAAASRTPVGGANAILKNVSSNPNRSPLLESRLPVTYHHSYRKSGWGP